MTQELETKVKQALKLLQSCSRSAGKPLEIAYSGGKDSDVILELAKMAGISYRAIYKLPVSASRATAYKPWIASPPTGAHSSSPTGTACTTTAKLSISTSSTLSSAAYINKKIMSKIKIKVTINMEHMSHDEQMRYFIHLADIGLLPPCPPEIRREYAEPENK